MTSLPQYRISYSVFAILNLFGTIGDTQNTSCRQIYFVSCRVDIQSLGGERVRDRNVTMVYYRADLVLGDVGVRPQGKIARAGVIIFVHGLSGDLL